jgi:2,3-bisphosphoglycerate-independent phosphoglycerate mutase
LSSRKDENKAAGLPFNEINAKESNLLISQGHLLMEKFIKDWRSVVGS